MSKVTNVKVTGVKVKGHRGHGQRSRTLVNVSKDSKESQDGSQLLYFFVHESTHNLAHWSPLVVSLTFKGIYNNCKPVSYLINIAFFPISITVELI